MVVMRYRRAGLAAGAIGLLVVAGAVWLLAGRSSPGVVAVPAVAPAKQPAGTPPSPPHGALVLAREHEALAVGLAAQRSGSNVRLTATVVAPDGTGVRGLALQFAVDGRTLPVAHPCGSGCYSSSANVRSPVQRVVIALHGEEQPGSMVAFELPARWPTPAAPLLKAVQRAFASLRSVEYRERLSSGPRVTSTSVFRTEAPDRLSYVSESGDAGVVIGKRRWDRVVGGGWKRSFQNPPLVMPAPPWGAGAYDVNALGTGKLGGRAVVRFSMFEPSTPAWYTVTLDRTTKRALLVEMTAAAHFMQDRYVAFDAPRQIFPPVAG
jgi:hypothetical protein